MKKVLIAMLVVAFFAAQGLALAEDVTADVQATAENAAAQATDVVASATDAVPAVAAEGENATEELLMTEEDEAVPAEETAETAVPEAPQM